jgi:hypothetical protein
VIQLAAEKTSNTREMLVCGDNGSRAVVETGRSRVVPPQFSKLLKPTIDQN